MQGFLQTPWNATSRTTIRYDSGYLTCSKKLTGSQLSLPHGTTAQDALWQHILDRNTSSQPFMTPCARHEPGAEGLGRCIHAQWAEQYTYQHRETDDQQGRPHRPRPPPHSGKATPCPVWHLPAIWNHLHIEDSCGFQWRDVDAVTPEFPQDLHNTSPEYFHHIAWYASPYPVVSQCSVMLVPGWTGWLAVISADVREAVAHLRHVRDDTL